MKRSDRQLGMDRSITRRDLLQGFGAAAAASFVPGQTFANAMLAQEMVAAGNYPPSLTGMRGSHVGSFEVAHQLAREGRSDWGSINNPDAGIYDLVVVGGGISGLSAAHFYLQDHPDARVLILDNHDDFGGHAKRNEFDIGGRKLIGYGGSQTLEDPHGYNAPAKKLLQDLRVDLEQFEDAYDWGFYKRHGLGPASHFSSNDWGSDHLVKYGIGGPETYLPLSDAKISASEAVAQMPMSEKARSQMLHLLTTTADCIPEIPMDQKEEYLYTLTYKDFLRKHLGVSEEDVFKALKNLTSDSSVGIDTTTAGSAFSYMSLPGNKALGLPGFVEDDPYIHHFPDGNASVARMLVRKMIPAVAPGSTMQDIVTARFDYGKLDCAGESVRLRLNSSVVRVQHAGNPATARFVDVTYVQNGQASKIRARNCILACYNAVVPHLCPELPTAQKEALALQVKAPILYTTVALNNWHAWKKLSVGGFASTGGYHVNTMLDFPVSLGDYRFAESPDEPIVVHMERFPHHPNAGLSMHEQRRLGRHELLATSFETIERNIREQLTGALSGGGFDPAKDIGGITVNRWAHGYSSGYGGLGATWYPDRDDERYPHVIARQAFGRISIANSDAGASAMLEEAVRQGHRAVSEIS